jgi:hypothetical protein
VHSYSEEFYPDEEDHKPQFRKKLHELARDVHRFFKAVENPRFEAAYLDWKTQRWADKADIRQRRRPPKSPNDIEKPGGLERKSGKRDLDQIGTDRPPLVFVSYSHEDAGEKEEFVNALKSISHRGLGHSRKLRFQVWADDKIGPGSNWDYELHRRMSEASIAILLISMGFLGSTYIMEKEVPRLIERQEKEGLILIPIIAKHCPWKRHAWLNSLEVRPKSTEPLWPQHSQTEKELNIIVEEIDNIVDDLIDAKKGRPNRGSSFDSSKSSIGAFKPSGQKIVLPRKLPISDKIAAGSATPVSDFSDEDVIGYIDQVGQSEFQHEGKPLDIAFRGKTRLDISKDYEHFVMQVIGDSMDQADILSGDYVILQRPKFMPINARAGDIVAVVFRDEDEKVTLKRYSEELNQAILKPESSNPEQKTLKLPLRTSEFDDPDKGYEIDESQVGIVGIAIAVLKPQPADSAPGESQG